MRGGDADASVAHPAIADSRPPSPRQQEQWADALPVRRWGRFASLPRIPASPRPRRARSISISDGQNSMQGMLSTSLNQHVEDGELKQGSIARIGQFLVSDLGKGAEAKCAPDPACTAPHRPNPRADPDLHRRGHRIAIILQLEVLQLEAELIGNPVAMDQAQPAAPAAPNGGGHQAAAMKGEGAGAGATQRAAPSGNFTPLKALNPYSTRWRIKARCVARACQALRRAITLRLFPPVRSVTNRSPVREWNKGPDNQGKLFSITLLDETVRALAKQRRRGRASAPALSRPSHRLFLGRCAGHGDAGHLLPRGRGQVLRHDAGGGGVHHLRRPRQARLPRLGIRAEPRLAHGGGARSR